MTHGRFARGLAAALLVLGTAGPAAAGPALEGLKPEIDRVLATLEDPALRAGARAAERRQAIRTITDGIFDWTEMAKRALGRHWEARTEGEQREFVTLFRDLLERAYISKIERYTREPIVYVGEAGDGDEATVRTKIALKAGQEVGVDYRMSRQGERWLVHDLVIEGISLVGNYRTQFDGVIKTSSYAELVKKIRTRIS